MNIPAEQKARALMTYGEALEQLRRDHHYTTDTDTEEGTGRLLVYDLCECGDEWPCPIATVILAIDEQLA